MSLERTIMTHRKVLHTHPELGYDLFQTKTYLEHALHKMGYATLTVAKTGVVAVRIGKTRSCVVFRADMDALPIHEETGLSYASTIPSRMHACGHDGHMAMVLGFAELIIKTPAPDKTIMFLFQPAEETAGGAQTILAENVFSGFQVEGIFGLHLDPSLDAHVLGFCEGIMMAHIAEFDVEITGVGGHSARPHEAKDALRAAAELITRFHTLSTPDLTIEDQAMMGIGHLRSGEASNVIAAHATFSGTVRAFNDTTQRLTLEVMRTYSDEISALHGVHIQLRFHSAYPAVFNDLRLSRLLEKAIQSVETRTIAPIPISDDFSFYQRVVPGVYMMLGTGHPNYQHPLHSSRFDFDETILLDGVNVYRDIAMALNVWPKGAEIIPTVSLKEKP